MSPHQTTHHTGCWLENPRGSGPGSHRSPQWGGGVAPAALGVLHAAAVGDRVLTQHRVPVCVVSDATAVHLCVRMHRVRHATACRPSLGLPFPRPTLPHKAATLEFSRGDKGFLPAPSFGFSWAHRRSKWQPSWRPEQGDGYTVCPSELGTGLWAGVLSPPFPGSVLDGLSQAGCRPLPRPQHGTCDCTDLFAFGIKASLPEP